MFDNNEDYSSWDATKLRKLLQNENLISKVYTSIDGNSGKEEYVYYRTKELKFKPTNSQGAGLNLKCFLEEAVTKDLKKGEDFFIDLEDYRKFLEGCKTGVQSNQREMVDEVTVDREVQSNIREAGNRIPENNIVHIVLSCSVIQLC